MKPVLLDTGPVVAFLDRADSHNARVRDALPGLLKGRTLVTTGAVVTEIFFLVQHCPDGPARAAAFLEAARIRVVDLFEPTLINACARLMGKYADTPMDFADATLVLLAAHLDAPDVLTLDERGFRTYRFKDKRAFNLLLQNLSFPS